MSFDISKYPTLALVDSTQELRLLPKESLPKLCDELRRYLLDSVSRSSGHFASGLGAIELTVALHYVYNTPFDRLIWDVAIRLIHTKSSPDVAIKSAQSARKADCTRSRGAAKASMTS
ncbi:1-deoxy-D-xylulose-5-phosphate synthase [Atlantibacter hermannii]|nr:1-deoxy-D-xylulose-5-phosphate synthase [Atlantibacter hermannii]